MTDYDALIKELREYAKRHCPLDNAAGICGCIGANETADAIEELINIRDRQRNILMRYGGETGIRQILEINQSLSKRNAEKIPRWIPVTERLPEERKGVLIWERRYPLPYAAALFSDGWYIVGSCGVRVAINPTHWQPLPEPPKEET